MRCKAACCRCCKASPASKRWTCPRLPAATPGRLKWWAYRSPGFHVVEIASLKLGTSLLDERHGNGRTMFVRTSALMTNLAVHFKLGRENALAWVTTLDKGAPVAGAKERVSDCSGREIATATSNAQGIASFSGVAAQAPICDSGKSTDYSNGRAYFVSARAAQAGVEDLAFSWSD